MSKYLNREQIIQIIGELDLEPGFMPMSQDSYNEELIAQKIIKTGKANRLLEAAINLSVIGFGNRRYGSFRTQDQVIDIGQLFDQCGVLYKNSTGALLKDDDLTPNRLCRFFRYQIWEYVKRSKLQTYLYRKYSNRDEKYFDICFRGAEYLDELNADQLEFLLQTYRNLDLSLGTHITERLIRVNQAKGKLSNKVIL
jgi:hypothetical protein